MSVYNDGRQVMVLQQGTMPQAMVPQGMMPQRMMPQVSLSDSRSV